MAIAEAFGIPVAAHTKKASPYEVKWVDETVDTDGKLSGSLPGLKTSGAL